MVMRTDVLEEAGVAAPTTWDELLTASRTIKETTGKTGFAFPAAHQVWFPVNYYLWSNGAEFISADGNGGYEIGVSQDQLAAAMGYFKTYIDEGLAINRHDGGRLGSADPSGRADAGGQFQHR